MKVVSTSFAIRKSAGLPNVTGAGESHNGSLASMTGAFSTLSTSNSVGANFGSGFTKAFNFNASRSSTIYGNSTTVTPLSLSAKIVLKY